MTETFEFRMGDDDAERYLPAGVGVRMGIARKFEVSASDPLYHAIERVHRSLQNEGKHGLITSWMVRREYSGDEMAHAPLLRVRVRRVFEPAGEECGTKYDDTVACGLCGADAAQITPLMLDKRRVPKGIDVARTIAGEVIVSGRAVETFARHGLTGARFEAVQFPKRKQVRVPDWFQLRTVGSSVDVDPTSHVGRTPFDEGMPEDVCPRGHRIGYSIVSEVFIKSHSYEGGDFVGTRQSVGVRRGLLRPNPILLMSTRAWRAWEAAKLKGLQFEIAHLV